MKLMSMIMRDLEERESTTGQAEPMLDKKSVRQAVNEERVFRNVPKRHECSEKLESDFDE